MDKFVNPVANNIKYNIARFGFFKPNLAVWGLTWFDTAASDKPAQTQIIHITKFRDTFVYLGSPVVTPAFEPLIVMICGFETTLALHFYLILFL